MLVDKKPKSKKGRPPSPQGYFDFRPRIRLPQKYLLFKNTLCKSAKGRNIISLLIEKILDDITSSCQNYEECETLIFDIIQSTSLLLTTKENISQHSVPKNNTLQLNDLDLAGLVD